MGPQTQTTADAALSEQWLAKTDETLAFYRALRDKFEPGKPFWNTETADAACGGNPWGGTFLDTFRYLDQLGRLAKQDVRVVAHNTLVASDYGLLEEKHVYTEAELLGVATVAQTHGHHGARIGRADPGGSACLCAVPARHSRRRRAAGDQHGQIHSSGAHDPTSRQSATPCRRLHSTARTWQLNGAPLALGANDALPTLTGAATAAGTVTLAPATVTFIAIPMAVNSACQ